MQPPAPPSTPPRLPENLFLVGPMGAGKSSIGRQLAKRLHKTFYDSDAEIVRRTGVDIATIFDIEGEEGFRRREAEMLDRLTRRADIVLATGGGAVLRAENRRILRERGRVIYLDVAIELLYERVMRNASRPLLKTPAPYATLETLLRQRAPLYREVAHCVVPLPDAPLADSIQRALEAVTP